MSRYCLDTCAYSNFKRGDPEVVDLVSHAEWIGVPAIVQGELLVGFLLGAKRRRNETALREFLEHRSVELLAIDERTAVHYAAIVVALRKAGTPIPTNDIWIAAAAAREGVPVLTYDAHFERIKRVGVCLMGR